jgi:hypothetical protein
MKKIDLKKVLIGLAAVSIMSIAPVGYSGLQAQETKTTPKSGTGTEVQLKMDNKIHIVEVGKISKDENGLSALTVFSEAISGEISMSSITDMYPIVVCAQLEDGTILDPVTLAGGVEGGSGFESTTVDVTKTLVKNTSDKGGGGGAWTSSVKGKGYLSYGFNTGKPIKSILIGSYADYSESNYDGFVKVSAVYEKTQPSTETEKR